MSEQCHYLLRRTVRAYKWHHIGKIYRQLAAETEADYLNRKLNVTRLAKHCCVCGCIQEASITHSTSAWKRLFCLWAISLKMAQGKEQHNFAVRLLNKCRKSSQEPKGESEVPSISEFTIMWDKLSKCSVALHLKLFLGLSRTSLSLHFTFLPALKPFYLNLVK